MIYYKGLNSSEVLSSREKFGDNTITPPKEKSYLKIFLSKFNDPLIKVLIVAAIVSIIINILSKESSLLESIGIISAIIISTFVSFINEVKAQKEFNILKEINNKQKVKVFRDGKMCEIFISEIVVGDYLYIESGEEVAADGKIVSSIGLKVDESSLNGESKLSDKSAEDVEKYDTTYSPNQLLRGTIVAEGEGVYVVTAVGDNTEFGKTAKDANSSIKVVTPLEKQLVKLGKQIGIVGILVACLVLIILLIHSVSIGEISNNIFSPQNVLIFIKLLMIALTLIVMAVPEGLPMSITLSMAYSMRKMLKDNTLVRKISACETLGATTMICTDKTGTLTYNKMSVYEFKYNDINQIAADISLNTTSFLNGEDVIGNQTEGALLIYLKKQSLDYMSFRKSGTILHRIPFNSANKYMLTIYNFNGKIRCVVKGAPEIILNMVYGYTDEHYEDKKKVLSQIAEYQKRGMRTLAFASVDLDDRITDHFEELSPSYISSLGLKFDGYATLLDAVREDVPQSIQECQLAGIKIKIVTGDNTLTAIEIARQIGLWSENDSVEENVITGDNLEKLSDDIAKETLPKIKIIARARPTDKLRLVKLLQQMGEIVAVTGDGTNDAPALNHANVSLSMGSGTAVAKESSDIILLNNSFSNVVTAIQWGRSIYINIQKFILFQLTVNVACLIIALLSPILGVDFPLTVTQILWINLIMDTLAALALATEPSYKSVMKEKPRKDVSIVNKMMKHRILFYSILSSGASLIFLLIEKHLHPSEGMNIKFLTYFFCGFIVFQLWNLLNAKTFPENHSAFKNINSNKTFLFVIAIIFITQIFIINFGGKVMGTTPISFKAWLIIVTITSFPFILGEIFRSVKRRQYPNK